MSCLRHSGRLTPSPALNSSRSTSLLAYVLEAIEYARLDKPYITASPFNTPFYISKFNFTDLIPWLYSRNLSLLEGINLIATDLN